MSGFLHLALQLGDLGGALGVGHLVLALPLLALALLGLGDLKDVPDVLDDGLGDICV